MAERTDSSGGRPDHHAQLSELQRDLRAALGSPGHLQGDVHRDEDGVGPYFYPTRVVTEDPRRSSRRVEEVLGHALCLRVLEVTERLLAAGALPDLQGDRYRLHF